MHPAVAAAAAHAIKASGTLVQLPEDDFLRLVSRMEEPLVVRAAPGFLRPKWRYLVGYKGFVCFTKARDALPLPGRVELFEADRIWLPE